MYRYIVKTYILLLLFFKFYGSYLTRQIYLKYLQKISTYNTYYYMYIHKYILHYRFKQMRC